jgi:hypothetical protein
MMKYTYILSVFFLAVLASCENQDVDYEDYDYQTVYFAYQSPVKTITLGDDIYSTSLDNEYKFEIEGTVGGVYEKSDNEITISIQVDNSLCEGLYFESGDKIVAMPSSYYTLASDKIVIPKGDVSGKVVVQLTDAFFADPLAIKNTYVIPLIMTHVEGADSILQGDPAVDNPNRCVDGDWNTVPKDYTLYCIKYINPWHGYYLRRGKDVITGKNGNTSLDTTIVRHKEYVEYDEVFQITTQSLKQTDFPLTFKDSGGHNINCTLILTFDDDGNCTVSAGSDDFTASGSGKFVTDGEKNSWGNKDRDGLYLSYEIDLDEMHVASVDTLVARNRGVISETFTPVQK